MVYFLSSKGPTPYDYFTRLADAFLNDRVYLTTNPPWLNELIPATANKYYVVYPPMPAVLSLPFVLFFGASFEQRYLAHLVGAGTVTLTMAMAWKIKKDKKLLIWTGCLAGLGNIIWFLSADGSAWYLAQITAAFFLTAAILESLREKRPLLMGIFLGAAYLSRLPTILALPFFLVILWPQRDLKKYLLFLAGVTPFIATNALYNLARFGVFWDKGYALIPEVLAEPWYNAGLFHISYIPKHLAIIFGALPKKIADPPFLIPSWRGLAIWITTPAFVYALRTNLKEKLVKASWLAIILISLVIFSHGTTGFAQFGYRFAVDFYPLLTFLVIKSVAKTGLKWHHWLLLTLGIVVNLWGILWINKFDWVTF